MLVEITIRQEDGTVACQMIREAHIPCEWKTPADSPIVEGDWRYFGWTYQPRVMLASKAGGY
jgi:hypothetical protein